MAEPSVCPRCGAALSPPGAFESLGGDTVPAWGEPQHDDIEGSPLDAIRSAPDNEPEHDEADPSLISAAAGPLAGLRLDSSVDPLHVHDTETHAAALAPEFPSETFLSDSPELADFLSGAATAPAGLTEGGVALSPSSDLTASETPTATPGQAPQPAASSAWPLALLASYASVMTIGFLWLWLGRGSVTQPARPSVSGTPEELPAESDRGLREDQSARLGRPEPLPENRSTTLGQALRLGQLEIVPVEVSAVPVELVRTRIDGQVETRDGGRNALCLRLRLRNLSEEAQFAPLDEAYVRDPDRRLPDSFLETPSGERIYTYPLPSRSEWHIVGQSFPVLRPGEVAEVLLFSAPGALPRLSGSITWRLRLRTAPGQSQSLLVRFDADAITTGGPAASASL